MIGRWPWHEILEEPENPDSQNEFSCKVSDRYDYRTLEMIAEYSMKNKMVFPEGPESAEWINYKKTPNETHRSFTKEEQRWSRIPGKYVNLFAKRNLSPEDYIIRL